MRRLAVEHHVANVVDQHRLKHGNRRVFRFKLQDYLFLKKINTLQGNAITIHSMSMTLGV